MKRLAGLVLTVLAGIAALAAVVGAPARSADTYRVDAIFDTAKGVIPGQLVKIAGARVGTIEDVRLTEDYKARIIMEVPRRFAFREDASCNIQPEGLISENFVQCDPGRPGAGELKGEGDLPPTVPVERTAVPVSLTDLFRIFQADVRQRFTVAVAALGGGLAARGEDLNAILRRANPTLAAVRRLTRDLAAQKGQLVRAVEDTDRVIAALARDGDDVQRFIDSAGRVTARTASRRAALADGIRRLPALLDATDPAVENLDRLATRGRPLLGQLRASAPALERLLARVGPFADAGRPALRRLAATARRTRPVVGRAEPIVERLRTFAAGAGTTGGLLAETLVNLRDRGFVESLNRFSYFGAAAQARYDTKSHLFPSHPEFGGCSPYAETPVAGCNAFFGGERATARRSKRRTGRSTPARSAPAPAASTPAPAATPRPSAPGRPKRPKLPKLPELPDALKPVEELTDQLQDTLGTLPPKLQDALSQRRPDAQAIADLTDFLLGS